MTELHQQDSPAGEVSRCIRRGFLNAHAQHNGVWVATSQHYEELADAIVEMARENPEDAKWHLANGFLLMIESSSNFRAAIDTLIERNGGNRFSHGVLAGLSDARTF